MRAHHITLASQDGRDLVAEKRVEAARALAEQASEVSVQRALQIYNEQHLASLRDGARRFRQLETALAKLCEASIKSLTRASLQAIIDDKAHTAPGAANRLKAAIAAFTRWSVTRGYLDNDPGLGLQKPTKEVPRELVLSIQQVQGIISASHQMGELWGPLIRLLVLTGQRRGDITGLTFNETNLDAARLEISGERTKNGKPHIVHLNETALAEVEMVLKERLSQESRFNEECNLLFTTNRQRAVSGFGRMKRRLDKLLGVGEGKFPEWRLHDLRTAFATALAEAGEAEGVVDRVLNHVASGSSVTTVSRVYNRAGLLEQRAACLERWGRMLAGEVGQVIPLRVGGA